MRHFGLIGYPVAHSFSKKYFTDKFKRENITDAQYELFELSNINDLPELVKNNPDLQGLNVTIPHKETVIPFLDKLDESAENVGAVNVIKFENGQKKIGFNSDFYGFVTTMENFLPENRESIKALVLGTGGASKAVEAGLRRMKIPYRTISRHREKADLTYRDLNGAILSEYNLIINTTPLGMEPNIHHCPDIPYQYLNENNYLFDLVYTPENTLFLRKGMEQGAQTLGGLGMLKLQAEKAWEIWNN